MTRLFHTGTVLTAVLAVLFVGAGTVQAQTITPPGTAVSATAANPTFTYGTATVKCNTGTSAGTTKNPPATHIDLTVAFSGNCNISGLAATITCSGTVRSKADAALGATSGTFDLNAGFTCTTSIAGVCNIDVEGPQTTGSVGTLNEGATTVTKTMAFAATRIGSSLCGPAVGKGSFTASYNLTPNTITVT